MDAEQRTLYKSALTDYPDWKLLKLGAEYRGPINHRVFEFMDALQSPPRSSEEVYNDRQITNHGYPERGKFFMKTTRELLLMGMTSAEYQQAHYWLMKIRFPDWEV